MTDLARRLGLEPATDITGRLDIQFQPGGTPRPWLEVFGQPNLKLIENACAAEMAALRYERSIDL